MMRRRTQVLARDALRATIAAVVLAGVALGAWRAADVVGRHDRAPAVARGPVSPTTVPEGKTAVSKKPTSPVSPPALGVYAGPGAASAAAAMSTSIGGKLSYVLDFQPASTWQSLSDPTWLAQAWAGTPYRLVVAVPMLPLSGGTLAQGAAGDYDQYFSLLAQRMVSDGLSSSVLMIGWQPEASQHLWQVTTRAQAALYVAFWDRIQATMAGVPGAHFLFEWDAGFLNTRLTPAWLYPGNNAVDLVADDAFDVGLSSVTPAEQWNLLVDMPHGPAWVAGFAEAHGKPLAIAMCGVGPSSSDWGGDNATFVTEALQWARSAHATMVVMWEDGAWSAPGQGFPQAAAALRQAVDQGVVGVSAAGPA